MTGTAPLAARFVPVVEPAAAELEYDPADYRKCTTCQQGSGAGCVAQNGRVVGGRPDGIRVLLPRPHVARRRRAGR